MAHNRIVSGNNPCVNKIKKQCSLPLTGAGVAIHIITELCVLEVTPEGLVLKELAPDVTVDEVVIIPEKIGCML